MLVSGRTTALKVSYSCTRIITGSGRTFRCLASATRRWNIWAMSMSNTLPLAHSNSSLQRHSPHMSNQPTETVWNLKNSSGEGIALIHLASCRHPLLKRAVIILRHDAPETDASLDDHSYSNPGRTIRTSTMHQDLKLTQAFHQTIMKAGCITGGVLDECNSA